MTSPALQEKVAALRHFNRFYTRTIGVLQRGYLDTEFSVTEARVLFEIARHPGVTAKELVADLGIDAGYLSRMLSNFEKRGLLYRDVAEHDGRQRLLRLTEAGADAFATLNARSHHLAERLLDPLDEKNREKLIKAMAVIEQSLRGEPRPAGNCILRPHKPGDLGWIIHRQAVMYYNEYGWGERFEALLAEILAEFGANFRPEKERAWIAELNGEIVGSIFCQYKSDEQAKLRLLYVEPKARGHRLGTRLCRECVEFARAAGYRRMTLWTHDCLLAARHIYEKLGFRIFKRETHREWGDVVNGEYWELDL